MHSANTSRVMGVEPKTGLDTANEYVNPKRRHNTGYPIRCVCADPSRTGNSTDGRKDMTLRLFYQQAAPVTPTRINPSAAAALLPYLRRLHDLEPCGHTVLKILRHLAYHIYHLPLIEFYEIKVLELVGVVVEPYLVGRGQHIPDTSQQWHTRFCVALCSVTFKYLLIMATSRPI